ncbi:hypothetical protein [Bifidobacterium pullorum]|uniref:hypothetical protein n=1 Tax=Bifidobacterium pullorum TaxID=78448 RepID=UPI00242B0D84|nr:hypothetical protein [Bifidobacterium pullorum]
MIDGKRNESFSIQGIPLIHIAESDVLGFIDLSGDHIAQPIIPPYRGCPCSKQ